MNAIFKFPNYFYTDFTFQISLSRNGDMKDSLESLKDLIEIYATKLILGQNYTLLSFMGMITQLFAYVLKIVTIGEENGSISSRNIRFFS